MPPSHTDAPSDSTNNESTETTIHDSTVSCVNDDALLKSYIPQATSCAFNFQSLLDAIPSSTNSDKCLYAIPEEDGAGVIPGGTRLIDICCASCGPFVGMFSSFLFFTSCD